MATAFPIPVSKAGRNLPVTQEDIEAMFDEHPEVYRAIVAEGLKVYVNKGMSKITGLKDMDEEELEEAHKAAFKIAQANWDALKEGKLKRSRSITGAKMSREETTFISNAAKALIKAAYKANGKKLPAKASVITQYAKDFIADEDNAEWLAETRKEFAELKSKSKPVDTGKVTAKLKAALDEAENTKPRVPPKRKEKADGTKTEKAPAAVVAAAKKQSGKGAEARTH